MSRIFCSDFLAKMFLSSGLAEKYVKCLRKIKPYVGHVVDWDPASKKFHLHSRPFKYTFVLFVCFFCCQNWHVATRPSEESSSVDVIGFAFAVMYVVDSLFAVVMVSNKNVVAAFMASASSFEERYCKKQSDLSFTEKRKLKSSKRICSIIGWVGLGPIGFALGFVACLLPKTLMNVLSYPPGSWLVTSMETCLGAFLPKIVAWLLTKLFVFLVNFYIYTVGYGWAVTLSIQILVGATALAIAISMFNRRLDKVESSHGHLSRQEILQKYQKILGMYREIQLLACYYNKINCYLVVAMVGAAVQGQVINFVGLISKDRSRSDGVAISLFLLMFNFQGMTLCVLCLNSIFRYCADVYENSRECVDKLNHSETLRMSKLLQRIIWSMPYVKVQFAKTNFIQRLSPVMYQQFTNEKIIDFLLLQQ